MIYWFQHVEHQKIQRYYCMKSKVTYDLYHKKLRLTKSLIKQTESHLLQHKQKRSNYYKKNNNSQILGCFKTCSSLRLKCIINYSHHRPPPSLQPSPPSPRLREPRRFLTFVLISNFYVWTLIFFFVPRLVYIERERRMPFKRGIC